MQDDPKTDSTEPEMQNTSLEGANDTPAPVANDPVASPDPTLTNDPSQSATPEQKPPRKKLTMPILVGIIVAVAIVILGGGGASAYFLWYQNPEKVVYDSFSNATQAKTLAFTGSLSATQDDGNYKIDLDGKANQDAAELDVNATTTASGNSFDVKGGMIVDKDGNIYLKVNDVQKLIQQQLGAESTTQLMTYFGSIIKEIDGQWIKISSDDLKSVDQTYGDTQSCVTDSIKSLENDKSQQQDIQKLFENNKFITVGKSLGSKNVNGTSSLGYELGFDKTKAVSFFKGLADTKFGKSMKDCNESIDFSKVSESDFDNTDGSTSTVTIWVSKFGHQMTELSLEGKDIDKKVTGTLVLDPIFDKPVSVDVPTSAKSIKDIYNDYQSSLDSLNSQFSSFDTTGSSDPYSMSI